VIVAGCTGQPIVEVSEPVFNCGDASKSLAKGQLRSSGKSPCCKEITTAGTSPFRGRGPCPLPVMFSQKNRSPGLKFPVCPLPVQPSISSFGTMNNSLRGGGWGASFQSSGSRGHESFGAANGFEMFRGKSPPDLMILQLRSVRLSGLIN